MFCYRKKKSNNYYMDGITSKFKDALETAAVVGTGGALGAAAASMLYARVPAVQIIPDFIAVGLGAGVVGGAARSIREGVMAGTYSFSINANTGLATGALAAFLQYSGTLNGLLPIGSAEVSHGFVAGALGGWFV